MTDIPDNYASFKRWRVKQTFATPELAQKAKHVESDLSILENISNAMPNTRALCLKSIAEFKEQFAAQG